MQFDGFFRAFALRFVQVSSVHSVLSGLPTELRRNIHFLKIQYENVGDDLFSRDASIRVSSAQVSLTSVFGMGTGGPSPLKIPTMVHLQGFEPGTH